MSPEHFRKRADDYRDAAVHCTGDDDKSGDLYSIAALFRDMADDLERHREQVSRPVRSFGLFMPFVWRKAA